MACFRPCSLPPMSSVPQVTTSVHPDQFCGPEGCSREGNGVPCQILLRITLPSIALRELASHGSVTQGWLCGDRCPVLCHCVSSLPWRFELPYFSSTHLKLVAQLSCNRSPLPDCTQGEIYDRRAHHTRSREEGRAEPCPCLPLAPRQLPSLIPGKTALPGPLPSHTPTVLARFCRPRFALAGTCSLMAATLSGCLLSLRLLLQPPLVVLDFQATANVSPSPFPSMCRLPPLTSHSRRSVLLFSIRMYQMKLCAGLA